MGLYRVDLLNPEILQVGDGRCSELGVQGGGSANLLPSSRRLKKI